MSTYNLEVSQGGTYKTTLSEQQSWSSGGITQDTTYNLVSSIVYHGSSGEGSGGEGSGGEGG